eukprot:NODE_76_length_23837_cov_1.242396.p12 type:complete len:213 gc:universal NODE_76_length_23837_cov_1.242396:23121-23759(+)
MLKRFARRLFIQVEETPNIDALKFKPGQTVTEHAQDVSRSNSQISPLAEYLYRIDGVQGVYFGPDFVSVTKDNASQWTVLKPMIFSTLTEFFTSKQPIYNDPSTLGNDTQILETDSETVKMLKTLIADRIRPYIQQDGGDINFVGYKDGVVHVKLQGACKTCSSSTITLKRGIESMMKHYVPEIKSVEQIEDEEELIANSAFKNLEKKLGEV